MMRLFTGPLPRWAQRDHPALRYELGQPARLPASVRYLRAFAQLFALAALLLIGTLIATDLLRRPAGINSVENIFNILYVPVIALQGLLSVIALDASVGFVPEQMARGAWDQLRATPGGVQVAMRARWVAAFYRGRLIIAAILIARAVLIALMLWEIMGFQGRYLTLLTNRITPEVSLPAAILLLSLSMTAALVLPVSSAGLDASVGLLLSVYVRGRTGSVLLLAGLLLARLAVIAALLMAGATYMRGEMIDLSAASAWLLLFAGGAVGDWGLGFLHLGRSGEIWATVPYALLLGTAAFAFALAQAVIADRLLVFAAAQGQKRE
ncbi:MAG: hypothetical protein L6Q98_19595 [Anaerolineae bacterium]|nr:hypothetical protein [Anaerolineae bacterium]NUQ06470.1 hypothetical protein [Anaerolineae bacterium]